MGDGARRYNLASDIGEQTDLAAKEPTKLKQLETAYAVWNKANVEPAWRVGSKKVDPDGQPKAKKKQAKVE